MNLIGNPIFYNKPNHNYTKANNEFGELEPVIYINMGPRVMLTTILLTKKGLRNGAMGTIDGIIYKEGQYPLALPINVLIHFDG